MSNPRTMIGVLAAVAVAVLDTHSLLAQTPGADSLLRRVRALDASVIAQSRTVDSVRRSLVRPVPPVDVRGGALHVRTVSELQSRVQVAVDSVAGLIERSGGP